MSAPQKRQPSYRPAEVLTPEMRDRQARGKNPYSKPDATEESDTSDPDCKMVSLGRGTNRAHSDSFAERERKGEAMSVLDSPEALMAHAQAQSDSISGQRLRFMRQLCGFDERTAHEPSQWSYSYGHVGPSATTNTTSATGTSASTGTPGSAQKHKSRRLNDDRDPVTSFSP